jgi:serine protease Do
LSTGLPCPPTREKPSQSIKQDMISSLSDYIGRNRTIIWLAVGGVAALLAAPFAVGPRAPWFGPDRHAEITATTTDRSALASTVNAEVGSAPHGRSKIASGAGFGARKTSGVYGGESAGTRSGYPADDLGAHDGEAKADSAADLALFAALERLERRLATAIAKARESVVALEYTAPDAPPGTRRVATGVVINQRGEALSIRIDQPLSSQSAGTASNSSVIVARDYSGRRHSVHWVAADPETGLTLLRLPPRAVRPIRAASGRTNLGSQVFVVGNPFGMGHSVSRGHVAGLDRALELGNRQLGSLIQVQAPLYPGDSGAAVVNLQGDWLGLIRSGLAMPRSGAAAGAGQNTASTGSDSAAAIAPSLAPTDISLGRPERDTDFGFAIPVQDALWVAEQLGTRGRVDRAYLGVRLEPSSAAAVTAVSEPTEQLEPTMTTAGALAPTETPVSLPTGADSLAPITDEGAILREVLSGTPASQAGLRPGDGIVELDGQPIRSTHDLTDRLDRIPAKATIRLGVVRDRGPRRHRLSLTLRTASRPETRQVAEASPAPAVATAITAASPIVGGGSPGPGDVRVASPDNEEAPVRPPQPDELRLTLPRAIVERLEKLERRLEKLESFPSRATGAASASDRQISSARNP